MKTKVGSGTERLQKVCIHTMIDGSSAKMVLDIAQSAAKIIQKLMLRKCK